MGVEGISGQAYQAYQQVGGKPALLDVSGALSSGKALTHRNAVEQWAGSAVNMGAQQAAAHKIDKVAASRFKLGSAGEKGATAPRGYAHWLGLGSTQVQSGQWNWKAFKQTTSANLSRFGEGLKAGHFSPKAYARETLGQRNFQPVKNLFTGNVGSTAGSSVGQGVLATAGLGLASFDVLKNTHDTHKDATARQAKGEKVNITQESLSAMGKYGLRDAVSWETAGAGFAVGKAVMPLSVKGIPVGGILFGSMGGVTAQKGMNVLLKTGDKDPVQQRKALEKAQKKSANPKHAAKNNNQNDWSQPVDPV